MKFKFREKEAAEAFASDNGGSVSELDGIFFVEQGDFSARAFCEETQSKCKKEKAMGEEVEEEDDENEMYEILDAMSQYFAQRFDLCLKYIYELEEAIWKHKHDGHIPPIHGAEKMKNALNALGIGGDYEVSKPVVWVSAKNGGREMEIEFPLK